MNTKLISTILTAAITLAVTIIEAAASAEKD